MARRTRLSSKGLRSVAMTTGWNDVLFTDTRDTPRAFSKVPMNATGTSNIMWTSPPLRDATWVACCGMLTCHSSSRYGRGLSQ
jgi:hypothetical protein